MPNKQIKPSKRLEKYLDETLKLVAKSKSPKQKLGSEMQRRIRNNDERKVRMLDYLFRSMADLIYFFEFVNNNPELIDKFDDDIQDLLGLNPQKPTSVIFERFIEAVIGGVTGFVEDYGKLEFAYRYRLLSIMQPIIRKKVMPVYSKPDPVSIQVEKLATEYTGEEAHALIFERFLNVEDKVKLLERYWTRAVNQKGQIKKPTRQLGF